MDPKRSRFGRRRFAEAREGAPEAMAEFIERTLRQQGNNDEYIDQVMRAVGILVGLELRQEDLETVAYISIGIARSGSVDIQYHMNILKELNIRNRIDRAMINALAALCMVLYYRQAAVGGL